MLDVLRMGEAEHDKDFCVLRENGHPVYLLLLVKTPSLFERDGAWQKIPPDTAVLFRPGQRHSYRADGAPYADCWMHISSPEPLLFESFPFGEPLPLHDKRRFYALFGIIRDEYFADRPNGNTVIRALTSALLEMLSAETGAHDPLFASFLALRERIFREPAAAWNAAASARTLGVSCGYFHTLYKRFFGTTFLADVIRARTERAEELLRATKEPVARIAERCGYWNVEHFIRQFRAATGVSPARWRRGV